MLNCGTRTGKPAIIGFLSRKIAVHDLIIIDKLEINTLFLLKINHD
jgi:hypothetical protein